MTYNRWTPSDQQSQLSIQSQIEGIFKFGPLDQILSVIRNNIDIAIQTFKTRTQKDLLISDKRKKFLSFLLDLAQKKYAKHGLG